MKNQSPAANNPNDVAVELPAPPGWRKQLIQKSGTSRKTDVVFISPTGEEIKNKRELQLYMKTHPGGPSISEFYWGSGDTPRRSSRLSAISKAVEETPKSEPPKKKQRKSSSKKEVKVNKDISTEITEENEGATKEVRRDTGGKDKGEDATDIEGQEGLRKEEAGADEDDVKGTEQKIEKVEDATIEEPKNQETGNRTADSKKKEVKGDTGGKDKGEDATDIEGQEGSKKEAVGADEDDVKGTEQKIEKVEDATMEEPKNQETDNKTADSKEEGSAIEEKNKEAKKGAGPDVGGAKVENDKDAEKYVEGPAKD